MTEQPEILTIGHSTHGIEEFVALLRLHDVTAVADVRSQPFSRHTPQFNRPALAATLREHNMQYVFLGRELGARSDHSDCYVDGRVQYERLARTDEFVAGIGRVLSGAATERIALMCTEKDPLDCHRTVLVARHLLAAGARISHIRADGSLESHDQAMDRLLRSFGVQPSLLQSRDQQVSEVLTRQEAKIAYVDTDLLATSRHADQ